MTCPEVQVAAKGQSFTGVQVFRGAGGQATAIGSVSGGESSCPGCTFCLVSVCEFDNGCRETGGGGTCADPDETQYVLMATRPPAPEQVERHICLGPAEQPVPVAAITNAVERRLTDELIPGDADVVVQPDAALSSTSRRSCAPTARGRRSRRRSSRPASASP